MQNTEVKNNIVNDDIKQYPPDCRIHECGRPKCGNRGILEWGDIQQYQVGPEKDQVSMRFCSSKCWKMFSWSMMDFYCKYPHAFPPKSYPSIIQGAGRQWKKLGYMDHEAENHLRREEAKESRNEKFMARKQAYTERMEREGQNIGQEDNSDNYVEIE